MASKTGVSIPIVVSGNILSEVSEKIPTDIVALNELIKNAYDAKAKSISIQIEQSSNRIVIKDDGHGMDLDGIHKLFHVSISDKNYGSTFSVDGHERLIQGSKGLGFLAAFKFGDRVRWQTTKNKITHEFELNFKEIQSLNDLSRFKIPIQTRTSKQANGTSITIESTEDLLSRIVSFFKDPSNLRKSTNSFVAETKIGRIVPDESFRIFFNMEGISYSTDLVIDPENQAKEVNFLGVRLNASGRLDYYHGGQKVYSQSVKLSDSRYSILADIAALRFPQGKNRRQFNIDPLFLRPDGGGLTPILYVNHNLFNNYTIFDTNVMMKVKQSQILSQMIGFIDVVSDDKNMGFNSDRTQFTQNSLTEAIVKDIERINRLIQKTGSTIRNELLGKVDFSVVKSVHGSEIKEGRILADFINPKMLLGQFVTVEKNGKELLFKLFDEQQSIKIVDQTQEEQNGSKPKYLHKEVLVGEIPDDAQNLMKTDGRNIEIYFNSEPRDKINWDQPGVWKVREESEGGNRITEYQVYSPKRPSAKAKIKKVEIHRVYGLDDLWIFKNTFGRDEKLVPQLKSEDSSVVIDSKKFTLSFESAGPHKSNMHLIDNATGISGESEWTFEAISRSRPIRSAKGKAQLIHLLFSSDALLPPDIKIVIAQTNALYDRGGFDFPLVAAFRTVVELVVNRILNQLGLKKDESFANNYKKIIHKGRELIERVDDGHDRVTMFSALNLIKGKENEKSFISLLNLGTHNGDALVNISMLESNGTNLSFLLEVLNILSIGSKTANKF